MRERNIYDNLQEKTEVLRENPAPCHSVYHKSHMDFRDCLTLNVEFFFSTKNLREFEVFKRNSHLK
jgi:hypothetical protein